ncbi:death domain-associated protein 6 isoform X1 [Electrophorus electricus]|uniref:Death domain-associated protein 6 n=1 Tax=Electrophorus electricus TaxID=8005 RepID=A0A4W4HFY3_ELEEL|nr:death domain-associated protein 6 isoform X1 [Electrophorus electricus]XP_026872068.2 death domain-associated protein 6 isoform X1 [Electrophorus electricus]
MDSIVIVDDDNEEPSSSTLCLQTTSCVSSTSKVGLSKPMHITESPFGTAKKEGYVLKAENEKLFGEFVEHCKTHTQDHPEVVAFLQMKYSKASPDYLSSVEFRNALGRCLTRAQANTAKTFVYINELCTVLKQHSAKRRALIQPNVKKQETKWSICEKEKRNVEGPDPTISGQLEGGEENIKKRASRRQIAYLENLLKVYNDEIRRLQERDLGLEDLEKEDSSYIQEHKLKRKMMKIYDKLCELKGCSTLTGRVIEQRIPFNGTRYPEINKKIERFINRLEAQHNPPDYSDILQVVKRANDRYELLLSRKQQAQIAQEAFRETGNRLQERRHLDMVYNFGSHITDFYKTTSDPALSDSVLAQKLRYNRELALTNLEEVISSYANKQDDTEEEERKKRQEKGRQKKEQSETKAHEQEKSEDEQEEEVEEEEEEEEEDEDSSDVDIEEEIQASEAQLGADDCSDNEEEQLNNCDVEKSNKDGFSPSVILPSQVEDESESGGDVLQSVSEVCRNVTTEKSLDSKHGIESPSSSESPSQSEMGKLQSDMDKFASQNHLASAPDSISDLTEIVSANENSTSTPITVSASCSPLPHSPGVTDICNGRKRKRDSKMKSMTVQNGNIRRNSASETDIPLDMGVACSPVRADSTRADTPTQDLVSSSRATPPPKKNKVNVATQCDPEEVIILSDSD